MEKIAVLYGGNSAEREISLKSGRAVYQALINSQHDAELIDTRETSPLLLKQMGFQKAFIALHGRGGEDGVIQGVLEYLALPYTGSRVLGSALAMDKIRSKQVWLSCGLPTAQYVRVTPNQKIDYAQIFTRLGDILFVKPAREGSSIGMSRVDSPDQLESAVANAFEFDQDVLIEQFINGPEYTVSILDGQALPVISMQPERVFYDYEAKYLSNSTQYHCPCGLSAEDEKQVQELALQAYSALDASGWGRVDLMRAEDGTFYLLEANTIPGMTEKSLVPMAAKAAGISFEQLVSRILATAK
ncbi:D-alanine--D-alanine ligase [Catenovulum sediminis]|uniref:D-alanine--D-alanine ligase n=1 Tax=Catenovulum sediminis TaxID=1740262 RepID=A0ABV1RG64_9ALTE|nr:D-alanine--D-alanine ligase [Catenovulum sediminis]